ncbi:MAG: hypothetical protein Q8L98_00820 [Chlamydiales bacterium]|nr:hypothetical protein [Chlamydiales bacterium]
MLRYTFMLTLNFSPLVNYLRGEGGGFFAPVCIAEEDDDDELWLFLFMFFGAQCDGPEPDVLVHFCKARRVNIEVDANF